MSTELEQIKKKASGVLGRDVTNGQWSEIVNLIDRAYALGRSERGEKMPVHVMEIAGAFWSSPFTAAIAKIHKPIDLNGGPFETEEQAIASARSFWARFGVEIEVKE